MRFEKLDLNLLVALDVLIEERSVSIAAKRLFLSQPASSGALDHPGRRVQPHHNEPQQVIEQERAGVTLRRSEVA